MDIGTANVTEATASRDLPLFRVTCDSGRVILTHDPGRGLITGKCEDVGAIVVQQFRGLAARAPYFSNGSARTLREVVDYYDRRFAIGFTEAEKGDLVNFLKVL
jgi:cytochrome c peroxidase